jgi:hypothetical protein
MALALDKHLDRLWANAVEPHGVGGRLALQSLLPDGDVGNLDEEPDPIRAG